MKLKGLRNSLILKLMGAFLLVIVTSALLIYFLTTRATQTAFRLYTTQNSQVWAERLAPDFASYYAQNGSWQGVANYMAAYDPTVAPSVSRGRGRSNGATGMGYSGWMGGLTDQRLILADAGGQVLVDTGGALAGSQLTDDELSGGHAVTVENALVGTLIVAPVEIKSSSDPAGAFLSSVNRSILIAVVAASGVSLLMVLFFFLQITAPIRKMQKAAGAIASGDLSQRVTVRSKDELGDLAQSFNHMASSLADAEDQRRKMIADVAHELRTPLAVIQANTEAMQDGVMELDLSQINVIHSEALLLARLINDLRLLSLAESGELRLEQRPTDLAGLMQQVVERFQPQCAQKGVSLRLTAGQNLPELHLDADRMTQVLNNLVGNALRYTPEGGAITLEADLAARRPGWVEVAVTDSGSGIAPEDLPKVFDRFYRADKSRARLSGGSGLGLAIVRQLVEAHGGQVAAHSPVFQRTHQAGAVGTRFTIALPIPNPAVR